MTIRQTMTDGAAEEGSATGERPRARRRSASVTLGITAILATTLFGCSGSGDGSAQGQYSGDGDDDYGAVCVDEDTDVRVDDDRCDDDGYYGGGGFAWYYLAVGSRVGPVGQRVSGGTFSLPSGEQASRGGVPRDGGVVSRGGFGGKSGSFGG